MGFDSRRFVARSDLDESLDALVAGRGAAPEIVWFPSRGGGLGRSLADLGGAVAVLLALAVATSLSAARAAAGAQSWLWLVVLLVMWAFVGRPAWRRTWTALRRPRPSGRRGAWLLPGQVFVWDGHQGGLYSRSDIIGLEWRRLRARVAGRVRPALVLAGRTGWGAVPLPVVDDGELATLNGWLQAPEVG